MPTLNVHLLPQLARPDELAGKTVVVIDVLRATTTIVSALAAGAKAVIPCQQIEEAQALAAESSEPVVLGGERGGLRITGFQLGNSPSEYTAESVGGKTVVFTTTNGTRALERCRQAARVLIGSFANLSALCEALSSEPAVELLCAGTDQEVTREDVLLAGAVVDALTRSGQWQLNDQARVAADAWRAVTQNLTSSRLLADALLASRGGQNLLAIGHEQDVALAAEIDRCEIVPQLDIATWTILPDSSLEEGEL